jgi:chemotaxis protein CheX
MTGSSEAQRQVELPENLDMSATVKLVELISAERGAALVVNASAVGRIGAQCLQILLSAKKTWASEDVSFRVVEPSRALLECLAVVGISRADLGIEGVAS